MHTIRVWIRTHIANFDCAVDYLINRIDYEYLLRKTLCHALPVVHEFEAYNLLAMYVADYRSDDTRKISPSIAV